LYSATAAAVVQSWLHEPCSVDYFTLFYVRQKASCTSVPPSHQIPSGDATEWLCKGGGGSTATQTPWIFGPPYKNSWRHPCD